MNKITYNGETKAVKEWASILGVKYATLSHHVRNNKGSEAIERIIKWRQGVTNPVTRETRTIPEWASILGIQDSSFRTRLKVWGVHDSRTFLDRDGLLGFSEGEQAGNLRLQIAKRNNQKLCLNPSTGAEKLACDWAKHYEVDVLEFYQVAKEYGKDSRELYQYFEGRKVAS